MTLDKRIYKALEDIVGARNISQDPAVTETYRCITAQSSAHYGPYDHRTPLPQAVVLPGSTEEVQQIIKICNKYDIHFKAASTFWAAMGYISSDNSIQMDMKRMANIEIDPKNQIAVVEPYAIGAVVQAEAMKYGLNCNIAGVGCSSSVLAGASSWVAFGPSSNYMGNGAENMLSAEWVLPNGEILKTGSLGAGSGWYCGEGPGPSVRAILRGWVGAAGTMGVCTKMAIRLHPWPGPAYLESRGDAPAYKADNLPNFRTYTLCFDDWNGYAEAFRLLHENDVVYLGHRQFNMFGRYIKTAMIKILTNPELQFCDIPALMEDPYLKEQNEKMKIDFQIVLAGMSEDDLQWKEDAVDEILKQTGGWKHELMMDKDIADWTLLYLIRLGHKNLNYTLCSSYEGNFGLSQNVFVTAPLMEEAAALQRKIEEDGTAVAATGGDSDMGGLSTIGGGGVTGWEFFTCFDAHDKDSIQGARELIDKTQEWMTEKGLGGDFGRWNVDARRPDAYDYTQEEHDKMFENLAQPLIAEYQYKIREAFNPNNLTGSYYRTKTPKEKSC